MRAKTFSKIRLKVWQFKIFGGVYSERVWEYPNKEKCGAFYGKGTPFLCLLRKKQAANEYPFAVLATNSFFRKDGKGMERKREHENSGFLPKQGNPLHETVCYKIGGTIYEVSTSCGGSERLYDKMKRLIKSETIKTPADKTAEVRYNEDSNLFVRRSLQEE